jgi:hypothetical protein
MVGPRTKNGHFKDSKRISEWKPMGSQPLGRPRLRWLDNVCDDQKVLKVRNWKELAMDRKAWNDLSEKAKTTKGCSANGRKMAITAYIVLSFSTFTSPI